MCIACNNASAAMLCLSNMCKGFWWPKTTSLNVVGIFLMTPSLPRWCASLTNLMYNIDNFFSLSCPRFLHLILKIFKASLKFFFLQIWSMIFLLLFILFKIVYKIRFFFNFIVLQFFLSHLPLFFWLLIVLLEKKIKINFFI